MPIQESPNDDPGLRIFRRLAKIQEAKRLGQKNLEAVLVRQIRRLYEAFVLNLRLK